MNTIWDIFIAYLGEDTLRIPHEQTCMAFEALKHFNALQKLGKERDIAFNTSRKEIKESTIDDAIKTTEEVINKLFETSPMSKKELREQKKQNKLIAQQVKHDYCQMLLHNGIAVV